MSVQFIRRQSLLSILAVFVLLAAPLARPALSQSGDHSSELRTLLASRDAEIKTLLDGAESNQATREKLKAVINSIIDFRGMGEIALGPYWETISETQQDSFVAVFSQIVRDQSISNLDIYRSKISYDKIEADQGSATVTTSTIYKDVPATVVYHFHKSPETGGAWMAYDFVLDEVSTAEGYAKSFQTVIRKRGFDNLMASLEKKRAQMAQK